MAHEFLACPFCGTVNDIIVKANGRIWTGQQWGEPTSVSVQHWCPPIKGQPSRMVERIGRDEESAVAMWNMRDGKEYKR
jgi:hypothetical protein